MNREGQFKINFYLPRTFPTFELVLRKVISLADIQFSGITQRIKAKTKNLLLFYSKKTPTSANATIKKLQFTYRNGTAVDYSLDFH